MRPADQSADSGSGRQQHNRYKASNRKHFNTYYLMLPKRCLNGLWPPSLDTQPGLRGHSALLAFDRIAGLQLAS